MTRARKLLTRKGFTLIEILVVIVIIGVLSIMGVGKYTEFTTQSRKSACLSNQTAIDKTMGVWESQNVALPAPTATQNLTFNTKGVIAATTVYYSGLAAPAGKTLVNGGNVIFTYTKDANVFCCPERANQAGGINALQTTPEQSYTFRVTPPTTPDAALNNKTRGVICVRFGATGPDATSATRHR